MRPVWDPRASSLRAKPPSCRAGRSLVGFVEQIDFPQSVRLARSDECIEIDIQLSDRSEKIQPRFGRPPGAHQLVVLLLREDDEFVPAAHADGLRPLIAGRAQEFAELGLCRLRLPTRHITSTSQTGSLSQDARRRLVTKEA